MLRDELLSRRQAAFDRRRVVRRAQALHSTQEKLKQDRADDWVISKATRCLAQEEEAKALKQYKAARRQEVNARKWKVLDAQLANSLDQNQVLEKSRCFIPSGFEAPFPDRRFLSGTLTYPNISVSHDSGSQEVKLGLRRIARASTTSPQLVPLAGGVLGGRTGVFQNHRVTIEMGRLEELSRTRSQEKSKLSPGPRAPRNDIISKMVQAHRPSSRAMR